jgi:hypothetical protein
LKHSHTPIFCFIFFVYLGRTVFYLIFPLFWLFNQLINSCLSVYHACIKKRYFGGFFGRYLHSFPFRMLVATSRLISFWV